MRIGSSLACTNLENKRDLLRMLYNLHIVISLQPKEYLCQNFPNTQLCSSGSMWVSILELRSGPQLRDGVCPNHNGILVD